jgi:hypothetical protein
MEAAAAATAKAAKAGAKAETETKVVAAVAAGAATAAAATAEGVEDVGMKAGAKVETETKVETAAAAAAAAKDGSALQIDAGLTAASSAALAKTDGSDGRVTLLPSWAAELVTLPVIAECCPAQVVVSAWKTLDSISAGVKTYVKSVAGILRVPASIHSAKAMRLAVQLFCVRTVKRNGTFCLIFCATYTTT